MPAPAARVIGVRGTDDRDLKKAWTAQTSDLTRMLRRKSVQMLVRPEFWDHALRGLIAQTLWDVVRRRPRHADWRRGGEHLAEWLLVNACGARSAALPALYVFTHSHGGQVAAYAFSKLGINELWQQGGRRVVWFACDLPVRRDMDSVYWEAVKALRYRNRDGQAAVVQTFSNAWNPKSRWRWLGAERFPWDHPMLTWGEPNTRAVVMLPQPGGHSAVLRDPDKYPEFWKGALKALAEEQQDRGLQVGVYIESGARRDA